MSHMIKLVSKAEKGCGEEIATLASVKYHAKGKIANVSSSTSSSSSKS